MEKIIEKDETLSTLLRLIKNIAGFGTYNRIKRAIDVFRYMNTNENNVKNSINKKTSKFTTLLSWNVNFKFIFICLN